LNTETREVGVVRLTWNWREYREGFIRLPTIDARVLHYDYGAAVSAPLMVNQRCNVSKFRCATKSANCSGLESAGGVERHQKNCGNGMLRLTSARGDKSTVEKPKAAVEKITDTSGDFGSGGGSTLRSGNTGRWREASGTDQR
jgi:hypothetical protein